MAQYIHAVPNFSDGKRPEVIAAVVEPLRNVSNVKLIDYFLKLEIFGRNQIIENHLLEI
jgi:glutamate formiminotransferase